MQQLIDSNLAKTEVEFFHCRHSNIDTCWQTTTRLVSDPPKELILWIDRAVFNPLTMLQDKCQRIVTWNGGSLKMSYCIINEQSLNDSQTDIETSAPQVFEYNIKGLVNHSGDAASGHYITHIRNKNRWCEINNTVVSVHEDHQRLTTNLSAIFAELHK